MNAYAFLKKHIKDETKFFILDSKPGSAHGDTDYEFYYYNTKRFNKLSSNDVFIYRRPSKGTKNRRFYFYGGGKIEKIEKLDAIGNVRAIIKNGFEFVTPLTQGDQLLENYQWKFKKKEANTWERFFGQYGMNHIKLEDFSDLFGKLECVSSDDINKLNYDKDLEEDQLLDTSAVPSSFDINIVSKTNKKNKKAKSEDSKAVVRKIDFLEQHAKNMKLGTLGELQVIALEKKYLIENGRPDLAKRVEHTAERLGLGHEFDVGSFNLDGTDKPIEVKTTRQNNQEGFIISPREIEASKKHENYTIYRLYNFDEKAGKADLYMIQGPITVKKFNLTPTAYRVSFK